ncbi:hypothetical protein [Alteromonas sp. KUL49]|uniref:hypothetical protein n=1 Tax=Alteromonas sp. KUL49 TaxID=2480798 RepID=UPI00102F2A02|nr:hypothetical protein [Alteromonas sp. KUL49]TAP40939.1 hypothetical protein EYS00_07485 [Alteromonas sp. KUL49]GEA11121.1 hypothetical protein KUL49_14960 [Alteromonas sp. KUL49]
MEKQYLQFDDYDGNSIVGSRDGLLELQRTLNECLEEGSSEIIHEGSTWLRIELKNDLCEPEPLSLVDNLKFTIELLLIGTWFLFYHSWQ